MADSTQALPVILKVQEALLAYGNQMCANIMPYGMELFYAFGLLAISWQGVKIMMEGGVITEVIAPMLQTIFLIGVVYWMLGAGSAAGYLEVTGLVTNLLDSVADSLAYGGGTYGQSIISGANAMFKMLEIPQTILDALLVNSTDWYDTLKIVVSNFLVFILAGFQYLLIIVSVLLYLLMALAGLVLISLAVALGPLFIPFLLFDPLKNLFSGWFEFFVSAGMYKVIAAGFVGLITTTMLKVSSMVSMPPLETSSVGELSQAVVENFMMSFIATVFSLLSAYLMLQIPAIARGMMAGNAATNIRGVSGMRGGGGASNVPNQGSAGSVASASPASAAATAATGKPPIA